jgi:hypothetical protein
MYVRLKMNVRKAFPSVSAALKCRPGHQSKDSPPDEQLHIMTKLRVIFSTCVQHVLWRLNSQTNMRSNSQTNTVKQTNKQTYLVWWLLCNSWLKLLTAVEQDSAVEMFTRHCLLIE